MESGPERAAVQYIPPERKSDSGKPAGSGNQSQSHEQWLGYAHDWAYRLLRDYLARVGKGDGLVSTLAILEERPEPVTYPELHLGLPRAERERRVLEFVPEGRSFVYLGFDPPELEQELALVWAARADGAEATWSEIEIHEGYAGAVSLGAQTKLSSQDVDAFDEPDHYRFLTGTLGIGDSTDESIFELWSRVEEHPDFVFGTVFVTEDFETVPDEFRPDKAQDALNEAGVEYIKDCYDDEMPLANEPDFDEDDEAVVEDGQTWDELPSLDAVPQRISTGNSFLDRLLTASVHHLEERLARGERDRYYFAIAHQNSEDWLYKPIPPSLTRAASQDRAQSVMGEWKPDGYVFIDLTKPRKDGTQTAKLLGVWRDHENIRMKSVFNHSAGERLSDQLEFSGPPS